MSVLARLTNLEYAVHELRAAVARLERATLDEADNKHLYPVPYQAPYPVVSHPLVVHCTSVAVDSELTCPPSDVVAMSSPMAPSQTHEVAPGQEIKHD